MEPEVTREVLEHLHRVANAAWPKEACGILLGEGVHITHFMEAENVHATSLTHFEIDPQVLIDAYRTQRDGGPGIMGYFHSHPKGAAKPSETDQAMAARDGKVWAIWGEGEVRLWCDAPGGFKELRFNVV